MHVYVQNKIKVGNMGGVAVEKHEMPSWIDTFRDMLGKKTRIVIHRKKLGGQYHKILDKSMTAV